MLSQSRFVLEIVNQAGFYACVLREISVPTELALGHLRCCVTDMPPQPNSPSGRCLETRLSYRPEGRSDWRSFQHGWVLTRPSPPGGRDDGGPQDSCGQKPRGPLVKAVSRLFFIPNLDGVMPRGRHENHWSLNSISEATFRVVVFHLCFRFHLYYTSDVAAQSQTGVKLNRVFFPRLALQVRSLDCRFAR